MTNIDEPGHVAQTEGSHERRSALQLMAPTELSEALSHVVEAQRRVFQASGRTDLDLRFAQSLLRSLVAEMHYAEKAERLLEQRVPLSDRFPDGWPAPHVGLTPRQVILLARLAGSLEPQRLPPGKVCDAMRQDGLPCRGHPTYGSDRCHPHAGTTVAESIEQSRRQSEEELRTALAEYATLLLEHRIAITDGLRATVTQGRSYLDLQKQIAEEILEERRIEE